MSNISWSFQNRTVIITGASRGIGLATANLFANAGANVFALSRTLPTEELHPAATAIAVDVRSSADLARAAAVAAAKSGRIDICVANAGGVLVEDFATSLEDDWRAQVDVNLLGVMRTWQAALPFMESVNGGRLIAVSSAAGVRGEPHIPTYSATKAAVSGLVQALALKYAPRSITVNCVAPGEIETMLNQEGRRQVAALTNAPPEALLEELVEKHIPLRRLGRADEVAKLIAYLASHEAAYITGQTLVLDGGQLLT